MCWHPAQGKNKKAVVLQMEDHGFARITRFQLGITELLSLI